jgi:hypothetical protein
MNAVTNTNTNTNVPDTKPLTRNQKQRRRYREKRRLKAIYEEEDRILETYGLDRVVLQLNAEHNSEFCKQKVYNILDKFISETNATDNIYQFQISCGDLSEGKKIYNKMKKDINPSYELFGSGYNCYGLYKSRDETIYFIIIKRQSYTHYVKIENDDIFGFLSNRSI